MTSLPIVKQLIILLHWILVFLHDWFASVGLSEHWTWGLAIIGLTVIVRLVLFPLTWKQYASSQAMQVVQPKIKELQAKYKNDREKLQTETMKLYQEHKVNPFASCLPLLLQFPVFISLYYAIKGTDYLDAASTAALSNASFLWIDKLGQPDPTYILLIIYVVSQLISTELMLTSQTEKSQKYMMRAMPIMFVFMLYRFPAGLFVYWVTTNLWTIGQQLIIKKVMKPSVLEAGKPGKPAKRSRFMDAMMHSQEERAKTREDLLAKRGALEETAGKGGGSKGAAGKGTGGPQSAKTREDVLAKRRAALQQEAGKGSGKGGAGRQSAKKGGSRPAGKQQGKKAPPPGKGKGKNKSGPADG